MRVCQAAPIIIRVIAGVVMVVTVSSAPVIITIITSNNVFVSAKEVKIGAKISNTPLSFIS